MLTNTIVSLSALLCFQAVALSQQTTITIAKLEAAKAHISALSGEKASLVDSVTPASSGIFTFNLTPKNHPGIYRLAFDRSKWIDFIHDGEEIEIVSDARALVDSLNVIRSASNRLYYAFRRLNQQYKTKSEILQLVLARYPQSEPYYATTRETAAGLQKGYLDFVRSAVAARPASFVARYIRSAQLPIVDFKEPLDKQLAYLKAHALDHVDFTDEALVHSDLFSSKSIEYLMYYRNSQLPKELLAREFNTAVDSILNRAKVNQVVYKHITQYLIDGFKQFGFEECISYILDNYVIKDDLCLDQASGSSIRRMIDQKKYLPIGAPAPNIVLPDTSGKPVSLTTIASEKVLVVFYSTTCPHCQTMIPHLSRTLKEKANVGVLAVSLDSKLDDWLAFIGTHALTWTNVIDAQGWGGRPASEYYIYATPTMILLDRDRKIIGKPMTVEEVEGLL